MTDDNDVGVPLTARLEIVNAKGLHARASAKFCETAQQFGADIEVSRESLTVSGRSLMGLLLLAAPKGSFIDVKASGADAAAALAALRELVESGFGEKD